MTKRKSDMARVAKALGLPLVTGETTSQLADRCEERAGELVGLVSGGGDEDNEPEAEPAPRAARPRKRSKRGDAAQGREAQS